jgi:hypothetical protein
MRAQFWAWERIVLVASLALGIFIGAGLFLNGKRTFFGALGDIGMAFLVFFGIGSILNAAVTLLSGILSPREKP